MSLIKLKRIVLSLSLILLTTACSNLDVKLLNQKATQLMKQGDVDGAIARLVSINDLNPNFPETYYNLGVAYDNKEEFDKSIKAFKDAIKIKKDFADAYFSLGVVYEKLAYEIIDKHFETTTINKKSKSKLCTKDKETLTDFLNKSIENFEQYLAVNPKAPDSEEVRYKISQLNDDIKGYCNYELKK